MFPNNMEFFLHEKEAERRTDIEQIRLLKTTREQGLAWRHHLGRITYGLGRRLTEWGKKLQQADPGMPEEKLESLST